MTNKPHPHADVLRAIADGVPLSEFEISLTESSSKAWYAVIELTPTWLMFSEEYNIRRKQQTHIVNGFTVPAPMDKEPSRNDCYFTTYFQDNSFVQKFTWVDDCSDCNLFKRGLCFSTKEAAIANAKAMLKIDPSKE